MNVFDSIRETIHTFMRELHTHKIKLLNVGSDRAGEWHWRFRTSTGDILTLKLERSE